MYKKAEWRKSSGRCQVDDDRKKVHKKKKDCFSLSAPSMAWHSRVSLALHFELSNKKGSNRCIWRIYTYLNPILSIDTSSLYPVNNSEMDILFNWTRYRRICVQKWKWEWFDSIIRKTGMESQTKKGYFSINMCSIRLIIWGRYYEVKIHPI